MPAFTSVRAAISYLSYEEIHALLRPNCFEMAIICLHFTFSRFVLYLTPSFSGANQFIECLLHVSVFILGHIPMEVSPQTVLMTPLPGRSRILLIACFFRNGMHAVESVISKDPLTRRNGSATRACRKHGPWIPNPAWRVTFIDGLSEATGPPQLPSLLTRSSPHT